MSDQEVAIDEEGEEPAVSTSLPATKGRRSFTQVKREMTEKELSSSGAQKLLLDDIDRLENALQAAHEFREKFHEKDKLAAVQEEKLASKAKNELLYDGCLVAGSVLLGFAPNVWSDGQVGVYLLLTGAILVGTAIYTHWVRR